MPTLVEHYEKYFGQIEAGWSKDPDEKILPFQIIRFSGNDDYLVYASLGMNNIPLISPNSGKEIRQELMMIIKRSQESTVIVGILEDIIQEACFRRKAYLRGEVIGPRGPILKSKLEALYCANPVFLDESFFNCYIDPIGLIAFAWLMPIFRKEAEYIDKFGWPAFEKLLIQHENEMDFADFNRQVLPVDAKI